MTRDRLLKTIGRIYDSADDAYEVANLPVVDRLAARRHVYEPDLSRSPSPRAREASRAHAGGRRPRSAALRAGTRAPARSGTGTRLRRRRGLPRRNERAGESSRSTDSEAGKRAVAPPSGHRVRVLDCRHLSVFLNGQAVWTSRSRSRCATRCR